MPARSAGFFLYGDMTMKMKSASQAPGGKGTSAPIKYAVGSGSRPGGGKMTIPSSAPKNAKNHRNG